MTNSRQQLFEQTLSGLSLSQPETVALDGNDRVITYSHLPQAIACWRTTLDRLKVQRVAYNLDNCTTWALLDLALLTSNRTAVPVPGFFSPDQVRHLLKISGCEIYITAEPHSELGTLIMQGEGWYAWQLTPSAACAPPEGTAKITFTSGSTGTPKGVCLSAETLLQTANSLYTTLKSLNINKHLSLLPLSLLLENVAGLYANLLNGSSIVLRRMRDLGLEGSSHLNIQQFISSQADIQPNSIVLVPQQLLALTIAAELGMALPSSYHFIAVGGGKIAPSLLQRSRKLGLPVYEGYGLTECGSVVTLNRPGLDSPGSVGPPLDHVKLKVIDGEVVVQAPRMLGYLGDNKSPDQCVHTGDLGVMSENGFLTLNGRINNRIITSYGRNLSPEWVESELQSEIEIGLAAVFGDDQPENCALVTSRLGADEAAITKAIAQCNSRLPDYAQIGRWRLISLEQLQTNNCITANGRIRRHVVERVFSDYIHLKACPSQVGASISVASRTEREEISHT